MGISIFQYLPKNKYSCTTNMDTLLIWMGKEAGRNNYLHESCQIFLVTFKSNNFGEIKNLYVGNTLSFPSRIQHLKHSPSGVLQRGGRSPFGVLINCGLVCVHLVGGFNPSEKYKFVSWYDYSQYMESHKIHVRNHQPVIYYLHIPLQSIIPPSYNWSMNGSSQRGRAYLDSQHAKVPFWWPPSCGNALRWPCHLVQVGWIVQLDNQNGRL